MQTKVKVTTTFDCSLERAFKTPMLCDVTRVHTGYGMMPKVTHCTDDESWGQPGGSRKVFMEKNLMFKGGEAALDTVLARVENQYWRIEVSDFKYWSMGIIKMQGEWHTRELDTEKTEVIYAYNMFTKGFLAYPFHWFFTKVVWRNYMKQVINNIKKLAYQEAPYMHD